jgi:YVTN family beta-propeller protein
MRPGHTQSSARRSAAALRGHRAGRLAVAALAAVLAAAPTAHAARSEWRAAHSSPLGARAGWLRAIDARRSILAASGSPFANGPGQAPTVEVGGNPVGELFDHATHTLYVANGNDGTLSVINTAHCNAADTSGCQQTPPTVSVGAAPLALALERRTHTLYVSNYDNGNGNTVAMVNTTTCNATNTSGCDQTPPTVTVGSGPQLLAIDHTTDTVYVPNGGGDTVSIIDGATCNATNTSGCGNVGSVSAGASAGTVAVDQRTNTAYVANYIDGTVSLINTATCNGAIRSGCSQSLPTVTVGPEPSAVAIDRPTNTVYVEVGPSGNGSLGAVAMINGASCNATDTTGCAQTPRSTPDGSGPIWIDENPATRTVYAVNEGDMDISVINAATCNAIDGAGCHRVPPALGIGGRSSVTPGFPDNGAGAVAIDPSTNTVYASSQSEDNISVLNGASCDASNSAGCTPFAPTTTLGNGPLAVASDPAAHTVYIGNQNDGTVSVIDSASCNASNRDGCDRAWPTVTVGQVPQSIAFNPRTDTAYVANVAGDTVSVIDAATCNATNTSGCGRTPATVAVGDGPYALAVDLRHDTIYVANINDNTVSVIDGATCNGTDSSGCGQTPTTIAVGNSPAGVAIDQRTDTIYVANQNDNTLSVIDGTTCNAAATSGCAQTRPTIAVGNAPQQLAVDTANNTVYVANLGGESLSLIDTETCNGARSAGCAKPAPAVPVAGLPWGVAVDRASGGVYVSSIWDSDVARIDAATCNVTERNGCRATPIPLRMGGWSSGIAVDPSNRTAYVANNDDGTASLFGLPSH